MKKRFGLLGFALMAYVAALLVGAPIQAEAQTSGVSLDYTMKITTNDNTNVVDDPIADDLKGQPSPNTIGSSEGSSGELSLNGDSELFVESLPEPKAPSGWTFLGWYTKQAKTIWWNKSDALEKEDAKSAGQGDSAAWFLANGPSEFKNLRNLRDSEGKFDREDFWSRLVGIENDAKLVSVGSIISSDVKTLYAVYVPKSFTVRLWLNGYGTDMTDLGTDPITKRPRWSGVDFSLGAITSVRDYKTRVELGKLADDEKLGYTFLDWYDVDMETGKGTDSQIHKDEMPFMGQVFSKLVTEDFDVYAKWMRGGTPSGAFSRPERPALSSITLSSKNSKGFVDRDLDPCDKTGGLTICAELHADKDTGIGCDPSGLTFSVEGDSGYVKLEQSDVDKRYATLTVTDAASSTLTAYDSGATAKVKVVDSKTNLSGELEIVLKHKFSGRSVVTSYPSCESEGKGYVNCDECGDSVRKDITWAADGHRYVSHTEPASCTKDGCTMRYCVVCGKHEELPIAATGHDMDTQTIASCEGVATVNTCKVCNYKQTLTDSTQENHAWKSYKTVDTPATCNHAGSQSVHCANCDMTKDSEVVPATNTHVFGSWHVVKKATAEEDGLQERTCVGCGLKEEATILATGKAGAMVANKRSVDVNFAELMSGEAPSPEPVVPPTQTETPKSEPTQPETQPETKPETPSGSVKPSSGGITSGNGGGAGGAGASGASGGTAGTGSTGSTGGTGSAGSAGAAGGASANDAPAPDVSKAPVDDPGKTPSVGDGDATKPSDAPVATQPSSDAVKGATVYRLYNPSSTEHLYTTDVNEWKACVEAGWKDETGTSAVKMPEHSNTPVYRVYNQWSGEHHYTTDVNEKNVLVRGGWSDEGVAFYGADAGTVPVYRLFRGDGAPGAHHYTHDANERAVLISQGWADEAIAWSGI